MNRLTMAFMTGLVILAAQLVWGADGRLGLIEGGTCAEQGRVIQRDLDLVHNGTDGVSNETRQLENMSYTLRQIADQLQIPNIDVGGGVNTDLERLSTQILQARQALYNVNALLREIISSNEATAGVKAIADNAIVNNLTPARDRLDQAQAGVEGLQNKVNQLTAKLQQVVKPIQGASGSIHRLSGSLTNSSSRILNLASHATTDSERASRRVDELVRTCQP